MPPTGKQLQSSLPTGRELFWGMEGVARVLHRRKRGNLGGREGNPSPIGKGWGNSIKGQRKIATHRGGGNA